MIDGVGGGVPKLPPVTATAAGPGRAADRGNSVAAQPAATSSLARIAKDLAASPPVDTARVEALRTAIAGGSYRPDPDAIAAKMIALESPAPGNPAKR